MKDKERWLTKKEKKLYTWKESKRLAEEENEKKKKEN